MYEECTSDRSNYLERARRASQLTIPSLYPDEGQEEDATYANPYQSEGAKGVNNIANKMVLGLFPPNNTFFKMQLTPKILQEIGQSENDIKPAMSLAEQTIIDDMEESGLRPKLVYTCLLAIVGGSVIIHVPKEGDPEVYRLDCFGIRRDKKGNILKMCIKESISYLALEPSIRSKIKEKDLSEDKKNGKKDLTIYTCIIRDMNNKMVVWQEVEGTAINETRAEYRIEDCPYIFVPFVDRGGHFGRSYLEDYQGDLQSYEGLRQSLLESAAESARIIYLLAPNAILSIKDLKNAQSGDVLIGNPTDVTTIQSGKQMDMSIVVSEAQNIKQSLGSIFLMDSAVRRNAERVTAEEIRTVAQELEVALGGIYSTISNKVQKPMVRCYLNRSIQSGNIPSELRDVMKANIITGAAALGRGTEFNALSTLLTTLQGTLGPEHYISAIHPSEIINRLAYSLGVSTIGLVKTPEELQQEQAMAQQAEQERIMMEAEAPAAANAAYQQNGE